MSSFKIFQNYYADLVRCLPMDDVIFIAELFKSDLLPGNLEAELKSLPTSGDKASKFLDEVIKQDIQVEHNSGEADTQFTTLLAVMRSSGNDTVEKLADKIMTELNNNSSSSSSAVDDAVQWLSGHLKEDYIDMGLTKRDEENDPWLPLKITSFTTPVLIQLKQLQTKKDTEAATHERALGNIEDIPEVTKSPRLKCIEEIFESINSQYPNKILIEGHPGIGKTTISKEICVRWAKGELLCSDKLVFLLFLRDPAVRKISNEQELIEYFKTAASKVKPVQCYLQEKCGAGITFIIDGFDELNAELCRKSFFTRLIKGKVLNKAMVVVTSRPSASICFHKIVDRRIEILGFKESTREQYINEALKNDHKKVKKLQQHLKRYPNIEAVCYIPLILNIMIFLCKLDCLPPTTTKLYTTFILHTICHHLKRKGIMEEDDKVTKMEEFKKPVCDVLKMLEKVAFDGLIEDRIVFEEKDLPDHEMCKNDPTCFGLLQSTKCYSAETVGAPVLTFNFYHLQLQEYFAAKHVMGLPENEVYDLIKKHFFIKCHEWNHDDAAHSDEDINGDEEDLLSDDGHSSDGSHGSNSSDDSYGSDNSHGSDDSHSSDDSYGSDNSHGSDDSHSSDDSYGSDNSHGSDDSYNSDDSHSSDDSRGSDNSHSSDDSRGSDNSHSSDDSRGSDSNTLDDEHPDDVRNRLSYVWMFLFGLTKGEFVPLHRYLSSYSDEDESLQDCMPPPSKQLCVTPNVKMLSNSNALDSQCSSILPSIQNRISQNILLDDAKILFLFWCFQEAQDTKLCKALLDTTFRKGCINLENKVLHYYHIASLGLFLSKSNHKWKLLNLSSCYLIDKDIDDFHHFLCVKSSKKCTIEELNISNNDLTEEMLPFLTEIIGHLQVSFLNLSGNCIRLAGLKQICSAVTGASTIKALGIEMIGIKMHDVTITTLDKKSNIYDVINE